MFLLLLPLIIAAAVLIAVFLKPVAVSFVFDTNEMDMYATAEWMRFVRVEARIIDYRLHITVFLFRKKISSGFVKPGKKGRRSALIESMSLSNTSAKISYGFHEPHLTGIFGAAADFAAALVKTADIELEPEFRPDNEFLRIEAATDLNAGKTLFNMLRKKITGRRERYGTA
ncbi:MAG: hypothetical protein GX936_03945 [Clostridiales bacterium]|nr:hypothetical protein [Clostridiales bacterium]